MKRKDNTWLRTYYEWRDKQARHITVIYSISVCFHDLQKRFSNNLNTHFRCWLIFTTSQQHSLSFSLIHCYSCYYYSPIKWIRLSSLLRSRSLIHSLSLSLSLYYSLCLSSRFCCTVGRVALKVRRLLSIWNTWQKQCRAETADVQIR